MSLLRLIEKHLIKEVALWLAKEKVKAAVKAERRANSMRKYPKQFYDHLAHYGVLGMKWGVRKNPERAYGKAKSKALKLKNRSAKLDSKLAKTNKKLDKVTRKADRYDGDDNPYTTKKSQLEDKSKNLASKARAANEKKNKWADAMDKAFGKIDIDSLSEADIAAGKEYVNYILALQSSAAANRYLNSIR